MSNTARLHFSATPGNLSQYARCVIQQVTKRGKIVLPEVEVEQTNVTTTANKVKAYNRVCGFDPNSTIMPITFPHTLAFPLHMELMLHPLFPRTPMGLVHIRNSITQYRSLKSEEKLDIHAALANPVETSKGLEFDVITKVYTNGELVWESTSTNLIRQVSADKPAKAKIKNVARKPLAKRPMSERWILATNWGRRYAKVSGDINPIHMHPLSAKLFGFKGHIAHGMGSKAKTAAVLQKKLGTDACTIEVEFKLPIFLPRRVELHYSEEANGNGFEFDVRDTSGKKAHMVGRIRKLEEITKH